MEEHVAEPRDSCVCVCVCDLCVRADAPARSRKASAPFLSVTRDKSRRMMDGWV